MPGKCRCTGRILADTIERCVTCVHYDEMNNEHSPKTQSLPPQPTSSHIKAYHSPTTLPNPQTNTTPTASAHIYNHIFFPYPCFKPANARPTTPAANPAPTIANRTCLSYRSLLAHQIVALVPTKTPPKNRIWLSASALLSVLMGNVEGPASMFVPVTVYMVPTVMVKREKALRRAWRVVEAMIGI